MKTRSLSAAALVLLCVLGLYFTSGRSGPTSVAFAEDAAQAAAAQTDAAEPQPAAVDDSMHHFMEYLYQPRIAQLKSALAEPIADKAGWKPVKEASLTLAEGANLLLLRAPEKGRESWQTLSAAVRDDGGQLYQAARASDFTRARVHYEKMLQNCNACHQAFAEGKHQLEP